ncbi:hypothetical protein QJS10_CPA10g01401 [Acorus calamus]|uniref:Uncharacterized protein n=1 Tax=Acorus calamus TaxID=4465 RepID=A0AAV9DYT3_ACOCL|nr:hypothetical protein QJS10_CPA10g01401 [Acorus calamus]
MEESILQLKKRFRDFLLQLEGAGWDTQDLKLKVPQELLIEEEDRVDLADNK